MILSQPVLTLQMQLVLPSIIASMCSEQAAGTHNRYSAFTNCLVQLLPATCASPLWQQDVKTMISLN